MHATAVGQIGWRASRTPETTVLTAAAHPSISQPGKRPPRQQKVSQVHRELGQTHTAVVASKVEFDLVHHCSCRGGGARLYGGFAARIAWVHYIEKMAGAKAN